MKRRAKMRRPAAKARKVVKKRAAAKPGKLQEALLSLRADLDTQMRGRWQRSLPLDELLSDRWKRAQSLGFAEGASIYSLSLVFGEVRVGAKTWVGPYTVLDGSGGTLTVGAYCNLSAGVQVYTHDTVQWCLSAGRVARQTGAVSIGDCTYVGPDTVIQRGVSIGDHCVIGANSLVNRSIPPYSFAYGTPCRVRGRVVQDAQGNFSIEPLAADRTEEDFIHE